MVFGVLYNYWYGAKKVDSPLYGVARNAPESITDVKQLVIIVTQTDLISHISRLKPSSHRSLAPLKLPEPKDPINQMNHLNVGRANLPPLLPSEVRSLMAKKQVPV